MGVIYILYEARQFIVLLHQFLQSLSMIDNHRVFGYVLYAVYILERERYSWQRK